MPNLTSVTGNWVINFAQLDEGNPPFNKPKGTLSGPSLVSEVDPKYPPTLIKQHVDGEVVLYAIIRKDGSVDSIQLVHGIDPVLDKFSMEALARWKLRPRLARRAASGTGSRGAHPVPVPPPRNNPRFYCAGPAGRACCSLAAFPRAISPARTTQNCWAWALQLRAGRTIYPFSDSISVRFPRAKSCAVEANAPPNFPDLPAIFP